jgi:hypothetical protein
VAQTLSMSQLLRWKWKSEKSFATGIHNSELSSSYSSPAPAISVPGSEAAMLRHFQARMPDGLFVPEADAGTIRGAMEAA